MRTLFAALTVGLALLAGPALAGPFSDAQRAYPRVRAATSNVSASLEAELRAAGAAWPTRGIYLRAFKAEGVVELWAAPASGSRWVKVRDFPICAGSGDLGPKRREGDGQVPEGFYSVAVFNPWSRFHLSLGIDYPNAVDRHRAAGDPPGGDIMIHGSCASIGCLPLQDGPIESVYVAAVAARDAGQRQIPVHIFPCRFEDPACRARLTAQPRHAAFWAGLEPGYWAFSALGRPPVVQARPDGTYRLPRPPTGRSSATGAATGGA